MIFKLNKGIKAIFNKIKIKGLDEKSLEKPLEELKKVLINNEVASITASKITNDLKIKLKDYEHQRFKNPKPLVMEKLREAILEILKPSTSNSKLIKIIKKEKEENTPFIIVVLGINGTGKTTTIAKLGNAFLKEGLSVVFAAGDTFRAGAIDQITKHGKALNIKVIKSQYGSDPCAVAIDAIDHAHSKKIDVVVIDTSGRMQNNENLVRELEKIVRVVEPDLKIYVGDALTGNDILRQVQTFKERIGIDGIILTKIDADLKGGSALSVSHAVGKPIFFLGVGQGYDDLEKFDPEMIATDLTR